MNEHEIERISAAMNQARPDWPTKQLRTLLAHPQLADRPRRDVFVALAWVASEPNSATPYRVLEAGPWWKACGVDGTTSGGRREWPDDAHRCSVCSMAACWVERITLMPRRVISSATWVRMSSSKPRRMFGPRCTR